MDLVILAKLFDPQTSLVAINFGSIIVISSREHETTYSYRIIDGITIVSS